MIRTLMMVVTGLVLFVASAGVSWIMQPEPEETAEKMEEGETDTKKGSAPLSDVVVPDEGSSNRAEPPEPTQGSGSTTISPEMVVSPNGVSPAFVLQLSESIKNREKKLLARERRMQQEEKRIRLMLDDMRRARAEITSLMEQAELKASKARQLLEQTKALRTAGPAQDNQGSAAKPGSQTKNEIDDTTRKQNIHQIAEWLQEMPPENAAPVIEQWCNSGEFDLAIKVVSVLEQRDAAKILALIDKTLLIDLTARFQNFDSTKLK